MEMEKNYRRDDDRASSPFSKYLVALIMALAIIVFLFVIRKPKEDEIPVTEYETPITEEEIIDEVWDSSQIEQKDSSNLVFSIVDEQPEFPGGEEARIRFLAENVNYPMDARESGIQGTVFVVFVVEKDGSITNVELLRGIGGGCDEEALRVAKLMPKWTPGKYKGKPVRTLFRMPLRFALY